MSGCEFWVIPMSLSSFFLAAIRYGYVYKALENWRSYKMLFPLVTIGGGFRLSGCVLFYGKEVKHPVCRLKTAYAHAHTHTTDKFVFRITLLGCWAMKCKSRTECVSLLVRECVQHVLRIKWIIYNLISDFIVHVYTMGECVVCGGGGFSYGF